MNTPRELFQKRKARIRTALKNAANGKLRLSVFRSGKHIYAQIIEWPKELLNPGSVKSCSTEAATSTMVVLKLWLTLLAPLV